MRNGLHIMRAATGAVLAVALCALALAPRPADAVEMATAAREAILIDTSTGATLMDKNADALMPPASMSKLMTLYVLFMRLADGRVDLDDEFTVSERAWRTGGSTMFLEVGDRVRVEDLIRGVIVQSGNDACVVIAEALSGSEAAFADEMTRQARRLGMSESIFANATGLPDENHRMTTRELAILAQRLISDFPQYYGYFAELEFTYNEITQQNRNPLLYREIDADGLKTGHTQEAGYGLVASVERSGRRLILVVSGLESERQRADEGERLLEWGFREFATMRLFQRGEVVGNAPMWLGETDEAPLAVGDDIVVTVARAARADMRVSMIFDGPIPAPVAAGDEAGQLVVDVPGLPAQVFPLYAARNVAEAGVVGRLWAAVNYFIF